MNEIISKPFATGLSELCAFLHAAVIASTSLPSTSNTCHPNAANLSPIGSIGMISFIGPQFPHSEAISFQIPCKDQAEIDKYWDLLTADGGQESQCGWLKDKFGISWQVTSPEMGQYLGGPDPEGAQRATKAMLEMKKIDLAKMKKAYLGIHGD